MCDCRFPSLVDFLLSTLHPCSSSQEFSLFPSLVLLSHLFPSSAAPLSLTPFIPRVLNVLLSSRGEKVRALAAVSLCTISTREDISLLLSWIANQKTLNMRQNEANAILLMMTSFLDRRRDEDYEEMQNKMIEIVKRWEEREECTTWCDWNTNVLLSLRLRLSLSLPRLSSIPPLSSLTLSLRPMATAWIEYPERRTELPLLLAAFRHEIYRSLVMRWNDSMEIINQLLPHLLNDLVDERKETDRLIILRLLIRIVRGNGVEEKKEEIRRTIEGIDILSKR